MASKTQWKFLLMWPLNIYIFFFNIYCHLIEGVLFLCISVQLSSFWLIQKLHVKHIMIFFGIPPSITLHFIPQHFHFFSLSFTSPFFHLSNRMGNFRFAHTRISTCLGSFVPFHILLQMQYENFMIISSSCSFYILHQRKCYWPFEELDLLANLFKVIFIEMNFISVGSSQNLNINTNIQTKKPDRKHLFSTVSSSAPSKIDFVRIYCLIGSLLMRFN